MRMLIKKLLKKYKYPPEGRAEALQTVMMQCELWADNEDFDRDKESTRYDVKSTRNENIKLVAEEQIDYK